MANIASLGVKLGLDTATFTQALNDAKSSVNDFKDHVVEAFSAVAIYDFFKSLTSSAIEYSDSIVKAAKANEVSVASVLELSRALEENGGTAEQTSRVYSGFTQKLEAAFTGSSKAQEAFAKVGVSLKDLSTLSEQDLFKKTIKGLSDIDDAATRNATSTALFGRVLRGVDLKGLNDSLDENKGKFDDYEKSVTKAHELSLRLEAANKQLALSWTNAVIPALDALVERFTKSHSAMKAMEGAVGGYAEQWAYGLVNLISYAEQAGVAFGFLKNAMSFSGPSFGEKYAQTQKELAEITKSAEEATYAIYKAYHPVVELHDPKKDADKNPNRQVIESNVAQLGKAQDLNKEFEKRLNLQMASLQASKDGLLLTKDEHDQQQAIVKVLEEWMRASDAIDKQIASTTAKTAAGRSLIATLKQQQAAMGATVSTYVQQAYDIILKSQQQVSSQDQRQLDLAGQITKEYQNRLDLQLIALKTKENGLELTKNEKEMQEAITKVLEEYVKQVDSIDKKIVSTDQTTLAGKKMVEVLEQQKTLIGDITNEQVQATAAQVKLYEQTQDSFVYGWDKAYAQWVESGANAAEQGAKSFDVVVGGMTSALESFATTGKMNFKKFADDIIMNLIKIQIQAQATQIFSGMSFDSLLSFGGGGSTGGGPGGGSGISIPAFADGGSPPVGSPSLVGENGPELFIPSGSGTIIPNGQTSSMLGGSTQIHYNGPYIANMSAIDTQSATQFLAANKTTIWAANQSAQRSMPTSR